MPDPKSPQINVLEINPETYSEQLTVKLSQLNADIAKFQAPKIAVYTSEPLHFRMRAEFRIWHEGDKAFFAMHKPGDKQPFSIEQFPPGSKLINQLMGFLRDYINESVVLRHRLFSVEFLTTQSGEAIITMIYHRKLDQQWQNKASEIHQHLGVNIIGRSRKQKLVIGNDFVIEQLAVANTPYQYQQVESGFTQPNAGVNEKMLEWAQSCARQDINEPDKDLLELYCGNGNFTCVLANQFNKVLATEISKISVNSANYNINLNHIDNIDIVRLSSEELTQALNKVRPFRRLKDINLENYHFSTVFVDPPRAGLDKDTEKLVAGFDNILYISCNPETLKANLDTLIKTHRITQFAVFDQFPYTPHLECGVLLQKNP